jgi:PAT family beta-lactamase induction signal transducer AmpG
MVLIMGESSLAVKNSYIAIFSLNYFAQGASQSFFTTIIPIFLLQLIGFIDAGEIASVMSLVLLPFGVKFIYGMLSDKIGVKKLGRRKPWIIGPSIMSGLLWIMFPFILTPTNAMSLVLFIGIIIVIGIAMGDTAIDGMILDLYPKERLGRVQGICWGFRSVGIIAGGPLLVVFILLSGGIIDYAFVGLGIAMIFFSFLSLIVKESVKTIDVNVTANLKVIFLKRKNWKVYIFSFFMALSDGVIFLFIPLFILIQWGLVSGAGATIDLIGDPTQRDLYAPNALVAFIIGLGVIAGAILGGRMADLKSRKRSVYFSLIISVISFLLFVIPMIWPVLLIFAFILGGSTGWRNSAFSAVIGQESQQYPEMDSTYYATCNSFVNLGTTLGLEITSILFAGLAGLSSFMIYAIIFLFMAIITNVNYIPFKTLDPKEYEINLNDRG